MRSLGVVADCRADCSLEFAFDQYVAPCAGSSCRSQGSSVAGKAAQFRDEAPPGRQAGAISAGGTVLSFYESEFLSQLGERVRTLRSLRDMSRRELARQSGISERYIAQIEAGRGNVSIVLLLRLAQAIRE
jgi:DNA-binding XRE family transcriptional regulator